MTRSVDSVFIANWINLGSTAPVPKWSVDIEINWTRNDGTEGQHTSTQIFPNALAGVPNRRLKRYMEEIIMAELRLQLGIDIEE
jgi:hypothetical protein